MKRTTFFLLASLSVFALAGCGGGNASARTITAKGAPTTGSSLATTIDLNDTPESEIRNYYSSISSLSNSERTGTNLLKNLKPILQNMTYYSYDNVWKIYEITDREWSLSPASGDTYATYNSSTNTYTSYTYGSNSSPNNDPYVHALYRNVDENGVTIESGRITAWGVHDTQDGINREHVWPQSRGFKASSGANGPAGTDVHHLMAGDARVNQYHHNNYCYGNVASNGITVNGDSRAYLSGNLRGTPSNSVVSDSSFEVFEPQDCDKGNIARACFYMVACYNNYSGSDTITQYNPNLVLMDDSYDSEDGSVDSSSSTPVSMGILSDLLEWHREDPPDQYEIHRNNLIYENYQYNRNPFIDFPEWAEYVWGDKANSGVATPSTDKLNEFFDAGGGGESSSSEPTSSSSSSSQTSSNPASSSSSSSSSSSVQGDVTERTLSIDGTTNRVVEGDASSSSYNKKVSYTVLGGNSYAFGGFYAQASANNGGGFQLNGNHSSASSQYIANHTPLANLTKIEVVLNATSQGGLTLKAGNSRLPSSGTTITYSYSSASLTYTYTLDGTRPYFYLVPTGSRALYFTISLTFSDVSNSISTADAYAHSFLALSDAECDATGSTETMSNSGTWSFLSSMYSEWSTAIGTGFTNAVANPSGSDLQNAAARYDLAVGNHSTLDNFASRNVSSSNLRGGLDTMEEGKDYVILAMVVGVFAISLVIYFGLRHKYRHDA